MPLVSLVQLCLNAVTLDSLKACCDIASQPLDRLAGELTEQLLENIIARGKGWTDEMRMFLTPRIRKAIVPWNRGVFTLLGDKCKRLEEVLVVSKDVTFSTELVELMPSSVRVLDLDGATYWAGRGLPPLQGGAHWLYEVDYYIRYYSILRTCRIERCFRPPDTTTSGLSRVDLGRARATAADLVTILKNHPGLTFLRHYQLVTALCLLHMDRWKGCSTSPLPKYKLTNIDADFSHVVRCRMSPKAVLPPDALQLAVALCPLASSVRLRFDTSTPHDVVLPLTALTSLAELSAVCVTSGERTLLDFQDFRPILDRFGSTCLIFLELKVVEEVDPHVILRQCPRLEHLTLSGCGFTESCRPRCRLPPALPLLRTLFFADGDDFSWDHAAPQCFWTSALHSNEKRPSRLEGLFLESPRMSEETLDVVFGSSTRFPYLRSVCLRRSPEMTLGRLSALLRSADHLDYMRVEGLGPGPASNLKRHRPRLNIRIN